MGVNAMLKSNLKELLYARRLSIREFARMIDFRFETVRQLYNNEIYRIPIELIEKVCIELNCTPNDLFTIVKDGEVTKR
jgi:DNA-binding Xre family transcriptional regulator